ncbi:unnamed protein product [Acanthoscelides obtectus]|nr:unnamed protein product [Acanthoscelides obtectus]CAK1663050.1 hypothetical protein AOBTE_LOCUS23456 [Acanthoscelides obtectus]
MIPYPEIYSQHTKPRGPQTASTNTTILSKRPLQCPKADCNKFISVFTLESHFRYEHKEVPVFLTQVDARSTLEFFPKNLRYGVRNCIVLVRVIDYDFSNIMQQSSRYRQPATPRSLNHPLPQPTDTGPMMVLMAARLASCHLSIVQSSDTSDSTYTESNCTQVNAEEEPCTAQQDSEYDAGPLCPNDKVVIWLASNIPTNLSYTVAASTMNNRIRQKYFGPMMTLNESPIDLCKKGTCLILTHLHVNKMTDNGEKYLALDVVVHSPDQ